MRGVRGGRPLGGQRPERAGGVVGDERDAAAPARCLAQLLPRELERVVPGDRLPCAVLPHLRRLHAVGIVESLQRSLAARAQAACVHGVVRIALDLDRAPLARLDQHAAACRTLAAGAGVPVGHAREDVGGCHQVRDPLLRRRRCAARCGSSNADADELQEVTAVEDDRVAHSVPSGGRPRSPSWSGSARRPCVAGGS